MCNNESERGAVSAGEIRVLSKSGIDRLVLIRPACNTGGFTRHTPASLQYGMAGVAGKKRQTCTFTLLHSYVEYATVYDLIVEPIVSGLSYTIVVQEDLLATVYTERLGVLRGRLPALLEDGLGIYSGTHDPHPLDAIWQFKVAEGATIRKLCDIDEILYNLDNDI